MERCGSAVRDRKRARKAPSPQALFDLDRAQSIKTMHEANESGSTEQSQDSSKRVRISQEQTYHAKKTTDTSVTSVVSDEGHGSKQSGHTPTSVGVRDDSDEEEMDYSLEEASSKDPEVESTASDAIPTAKLPGTPG